MMVYQCVNMIEEVEGSTRMEAWKKLKIFKMQNATAACTFCVLNLRSQTFPNSPASCSAWWKGTTAIATLLLSTRSGVYGLSNLVYS